MNNDDVLKILESHLMNISNLKVYVSDQINIMNEIENDDAKASHALLVLRYVLHVFLKNIKP